MVDRLLVAKARCRSLPLWSLGLCLQGLFETRPSLDGAACCGVEVKCGVPQNLQRICRRNRSGIVVWRRRVGDRARCREAGERTDRYLQAMRGREFQELSEDAIPVVSAGSMGEAAEQPTVLPASSNTQMSLRQCPNLSTCRQSASGGHRTDRGLSGRPRRTATTCISVVSSREEAFERTHSDSDAIRQDFGLCPSLGPWWEHCGGGKHDGQFIPTFLVVSSNELFCSSTEIRRLAV